jgi:hypothetical protein
MRLRSAGLVSPPAERNKAPILTVLQRVLPQHGIVLEIASGTGQHVVHFAAALPGLTWQPSDPDAQARYSISAWIAASTLGNVREPLDLDVRLQPWPVAECDALICINMIHIAPWAATAALFAGANEVVAESGVVCLYGPYRVQHRHTAPSNDAFDRTLRAQNAEWGVRDLEEVVRLANTNGFELIETVAMPANNLSVVLRKCRGATRSSAADG